MTFVLYGEPDSGSFMIEAALAEAGQVVDLVDLDLTVARPTAYLALNPTGKIPALRFADGVLMTQSAAILLALSDIFPGAGLMPPPLHADRRQALRWLIFIAAEIYPLVEIEDYPRRFVPHDADIEAVQAMAIETARKRWLLVEEAAQGQGSFLESGFCAVDLMIAMVSTWLIGEDWRREHCPKIEAIARPLSGAVWRRHKGR